jgi:hypothetical protein
MDHTACDLFRTDRKVDRRLGSGDGDTHIQILVDGRRSFELRHRVFAALRARNELALIPTLDKFLIFENLCGHARSYRQADQTGITAQFTA